MELSTILVATDLSKRSLRAVHRAARLAGQHGSALHVLHVVDEDLPATIANDVRKSARLLMSETVAAFEKPLSAVEVEVRFGAASKTILATAEETAADLIVLGSHRARGVRELFRGTTLERVSKSARVPVLMVNTDALTDYRHCVVGVDFSPASRQAVADTARLCPDATITLASAYHIFFREFVDRAVPDDSDIHAERKLIERELKTRMTAFQATCPEHKPGFKVAFVEGGPAQGLETLAHSKEADLISVGSHGRSWLAEAFLGGTVKELLYTAPCDVLVAAP